MSAVPGTILRRSKDFVDEAIRRQVIGGDPRFNGPLRISSEVRSACADRAKGVITGHGGFTLPASERSSEATAEEELIWMFRNRSRQKVAPSSGPVTRESRKGPQAAGMGHRGFPRSIAVCAMDASQRRSEEKAP
jgi:hypothetical protein